MHESTSMVEYTTVLLDINHPYPKDGMAQSCSNQHPVCYLLFRGQPE